MNTTDIEGIKYMTLAKPRPICTGKKKGTSNKYTQLKKKCVYT